MDEKTAIAADTLELLLLNHTAIKAAFGAVPLS